MLVCGSHMKAYSNNCVCFFFFVKCLGNSLLMVAYISHHTAGCESLMEYLILGKSSDLSWDLSTPLFQICTCFLEKTFIKKTKKKK